MGSHAINPNNEQHEYRYCTSPAHTLDVYSFGLLRDSSLYVSPILVVLSSGNQRQQSAEFFPKHFLLCFATSCNLGITSISVYFLSIKSKSANKAMSTANVQVEEQIVLACEIPENAFPGSTFHVQLEDRFFEVMTPEGAVPGQTIHIVVPSVTALNPPPPPAAEPVKEKVYSSPQTIYVSADIPPNSTAQLGVLTQLRILGDRAFAQAKVLDEQYQISNKVGEIAKPAVDKMKSVDEKYKITETTSAASAQAKAKLVELDEKYELSNRTSAFIHQTVQKIQEIDQNHRVTEKVSTASSTVVLYAREIDSKFAVSATAGRIVQAGAAALVAAYNKAVEFDQQHKISERAAATIAAGATVVANKVQKLSSSSSAAVQETSETQSETFETTNPLASQTAATTNPSSQEDDDVRAL